MIKDFRYPVIVIGYGSADMNLLAVKEVTQHWYLSMNKEDIKLGMLLMFTYREKDGSHPLLHCTEIHKNYACVETVDGKGVYCSPYIYLMPAPRREYETLSAVDS